jgi:cytochrome c
MDCAHIGALDTLSTSWRRGEKMRISVVALTLALFSQAHAADSAHGAAIFSATCGVCHMARGDASRADLATRIGPNLWGVVGRKAGTSKGYVYSYAMRSSGLTWTVDQLRRYIAEPQKTVPNVRMSFTGLKNPQDVEDVIAYLNTRR